MPAKASPPPDVCSVPRSGIHGETNPLRGGCGLLRLRLQDWRWPGSRQSLSVTQLGCRPCCRRWRLTRLSRRSCLRGWGAGVSGIGRTLETPSPWPAQRCRSRALPRECAIVNQGAPKCSSARLAEASLSMAVGWDWRGASLRRSDRTRKYAIDTYRALLTGGTEPRPSWPSRRAQREASGAQPILRFGVGSAARSLRPCARSGSTTVVSLPNCTTPATPADCCCSGTAGSAARTASALFVCAETTRMTLGSLSCASTPWTTVSASRTA